MQGRASDILKLPEGIEASTQPGRALSLWHYFSHYQQIGLISASDVFTTCRLILRFDKKGLNHSRDYNSQRPNESKIIAPTPTTEEQDYFHRHRHNCIGIGGLFTVQGILQTTFTDGRKCH